ncbi:hypothetical protein EOD08_06485 [Mesorhizobium sp. M6A.T.Ca.TU.002.02.2.1]|nr:hypothetical protein EOD08_06485 [Mesorhizobium sp. M6A.T.Ca.TU.002.02.2.1]
MTNKETSNDYGDIIVTLNDTTRIINCPNNIQWIVQTLSGRRWRSCSFWRRRDALINRLDFEAQADGDYALTPQNREALEALPSIHGCVWLPSAQTGGGKTKNQGRQTTRFLHLDVPSMGGL